MARNSHLTLLLSFSVMLPLMVESRIRHFKCEVNYLPWSPDCSAESLLIAINGHFPGPTIDTIVVELHNMLPSEGVVIHGLRALGQMGRHPSRSVQSILGRLSFTSSK
ncbi:hypothetical protein AMTR_s00064p00152030 [Amborella trichopoda]|uniref:Plastocyanin-like domain-containing protein n=1 Tax=Amborella trichopoda TaxID=13333 RepID=U5DEE1_AMBTC|nr:hypothetical protein AMTR_s00064p00152030 [Amborella trichopoda]